jgi:hypothetical protein
MGPGDRHVAEGQARIATEKKRDKHDTIIVQEKLDGSCCGIAKVDGELFALTKKGYLASTSKFELHHQFSDWVARNNYRFDAILKDGERLVGEWMTVAHGTIYHLPHEPFVAFDIIGPGNKRLVFDEFMGRLTGFFTLPKLVSIGDPVSVENALNFLGKYGYHGAREQIEGAVWRVERKGVVDFLCKYVRADKVDGKYLGGLEVLNQWKAEV